MFVRLAVHMLAHWILRFTSESIKRFIEDQAFLRSYDSAPRPPPFNLLLPLTTCLSSKVFLVELTDGRAGGRGANSYDSEKAWPSIYYSILSVSVFDRLFYNGSRCRLLSWCRGFWISSVMTKLSNAHTQFCKDKSISNGSLTKGTYVIRGFYLNNCTAYLSVADPDPGSGAFLTPGSGIRYRFFPDPGSRISDPGSQDHIFKTFLTIFLVKSSIILWKLAQIFFFSTSKLK